MVFEKMRIDVMTPLFFIEDHSQNSSHNQFAKIKGNVFGTAERVTSPQSVKTSHLVEYWIVRQSMYSQVLLQINYINRV